MRPCIEEHSLPSFLHRRKRPYPLFSALGRDKRRPFFFPPFMGAGSPPLLSSSGPSFSLSLRPQAPDQDFLVLLSADKLMSAAVGSFFFFPGGRLGSRLMFFPPALSET